LSSPPPSPPLTKSQQQLSSTGSGGGNKQKQNKEKKSIPIIYRVTTGGLSPYTKASYQMHINDFLAFYKITDVDVVKDWSPRLARQHLIDYVIYLRDVKRFPRSSIKVHVAAVTHFLYMVRDDATRLDMTKVRMELPPDEFAHRDRPYTVDEIQKMLSVCPRPREKVIVLLLTSTGMRIGAIHSLKKKDIQPKETSQGKVYRIEVYSGSSASYYCYCNVETAKAIDEYFKERTSADGGGAGEVLNNDSPLIRNLYDIKKKAVKPLTRYGIIYLVYRIVKVSGIKSAFQFKGEAKGGLGFRKFYKTQAEESGMKSINVEVAHGHSIGISGRYYKPKPTDILQDYMLHAADALTIDDTQRLRQQIETQSEEAKVFWAKQKEQDARIKSLEDWLRTAGLIDSCD
jgi:integrase